MHAAALKKGQELFAYIDSNGSWSAKIFADFINAAIEEAAAPLVHLIDRFLNDQQSQNDLTEDAYHALAPFRTTRTSDHAHS